MRKFTLTMFGFLLALSSLNAQTACSDRNGFVDAKNTAGTGSYTLQMGMEEKAAQTYHYSVPGRITSVRVYGNYPGVVGGVPLRVGISNVDASGRPTTSLSTTNATWWWFNDVAGYITVNFGGGGVNVSNNFAVTVEVRNASPWGTSFQLQYTGNGEGLGQDLASLAGTSTGNNWSSAMTTFNKDGDFYLVPTMTNFINPAFTPSTSCVATNVPVSFMNLSSLTMDSMFNTIGLAGYSGNINYYNWDFGDGSPVSHVVNPTHAYAVAGSYTVTLTANIDGWNNDCSANVTNVISVGLASSATSTAVSCFGSSNGNVTLTGSGGASPYTFSLNSSAYQGTGVFNNLPAGNYTGVVMDNLGCSSIATVAVTQPQAIVIQNVLSTNSSCGSSNGALQVIAAGGTGALQYQLNTGSYQSGNQFNNLPSDFYQVNVKDANGCIVSGFGLVNDQGAPALTILSQTNVSCHAGNNGSIVLIGSGGSGTLQYSINGGANYQVSGSFPNLTAGIYEAMVKDANGCSSSAEISITQPNALGFTVNSTPASCNGDNDGEITISNAIGGTGTLLYSVNNIFYQSGNVFSGIAAGNYTVYVRDVPGCTATASVTVTQPTAITATATVTNATCNGSYTGSVTVNVSGGTLGYIYSIDGENFQRSNTFDELQAGTYTITVRDSHGCQVVITVTVTEPTPIAATITAGSSTCGNSNGTLLAVATGGSGSGYQYSIDGATFSGSGAFSGLLSGTYDIIITDGTGCENVFVTSINDANGPTITSASNTNLTCYGSADGTITVNTVSGGSGTLYYSVNGSTWQASPMFTGLDAGTYSVLVKDVNGCVGETSITLTQPSQIAVTVVTSDVTCFGSNSGSVTVNAAGGAGTLAYALALESSYQSSNQFNNLHAGTFTALVRDVAGCIGYQVFQINQPTPIVMHLSVLDVQCNGNNDGAIYVSAAGGTGILVYSKDGINYQSSAIFNNLTAGVYSIYVRDGNGCVALEPVTISQPAPLTVNAIVSDVICAGGNDGVIDLMVSGGTAPYEFNWSNESSTEDIFNLVAGTYSVTVTDNNGCTFSQSYTVNQPSNPLIVNGAVTNASSQSATDGGVDITVTGGSAPYTFSWSNGATTEDISSVAPGVYLVTITDASGCTTSGVYIVNFAIGIATQNVNTSAITLYPNPAHGNFTIDAGVQVVDKLELMDMLGQVVYSAEPKTSKIQVNTEGLSEGIYFVHMYINGAIVTKRVEVSK